jgi:hypothetical protein
MTAPKHITEMDVLDYLNAKARELMRTTGAWSACITVAHTSDFVGERRTTYFVHADDVCVQSMDSITDGIAQASAAFSQKTNQAGR